MRLMVPIACPPLLAPLLLKYMDEPMAIPSKRTIARGRLNFDLGFELSMRSTFCPTGLPCPKYWVWADSSPMGGNNWLLVHLHYSQCTSESNWRELMGAYHELCRRNENAPAHDLDDIDEGAQSDTASSEDGGDLKPSILEKHTVRMDDGNVDDWDSDFGDSAADALPTKPFAERTVADLSRVLCRSLSYHTPIPQALGTRAASLPHKTSCLTSTMSI